MKKFCLMLMFVLMWGLVGCGEAEEQTAVLPAMEVTLVATDIAYDNKFLEVKAGQPLKIILQNDGVLEHDFSIMKIPYTGEVLATEIEDDEMAGHDMSNMGEEPDVHVAALTNSSNTVEFTPSTPGAYQYYCTVAGHKESGMVGTLTVTEP